MCIRDRVDTVTVGYTDMASSPGWYCSLPWQDYMFKKMDEGYTIRESFDFASAQYPPISENVVFCGDESLKVNHKPDVPVITAGPTCGIPGLSYTYSVQATDFDGNQIYYMFDWGDGERSDWLGPYDSGQCTNLSHAWSVNGFYEIKVKAMDTLAESDWSSPFRVGISNPPNKPNKPYGPTSGKVGASYTYTTSTADPDGDRIKFCFDWGDGNESWTDFIASGGEGSASHTWHEKGSYSIRVKAIDEYGVESEWSDPLSVSMPKTFTMNIWGILEKINEWMMQAFGKELFPMT